MPGRRGSGKLDPIRVAAISSPGGKESPIRSTARLHVLAAILGLSLYVVGFQQQVHLAGLPAEPDREELAYPARLGPYQAGDAEQLRFLAEGFSPGEELDLVEADGTRHRVQLVRKQSTPYLWITALSSLFFWSMAALAFAPRIHRPGAPYFFWAILFYGLAVAVGGIYFRGARPWIWGLPGYVHLASLSFLPVLFVQLAGDFPRHILAAGPWKRLPRILLVLAVVSLAWQLFVFERYFLDPGPANGAHLPRPQQLADLLMVVQVVIGIVLLHTQSRRARTIRERRQVRWLVYGFLLGVTPYVFLRTLPTAIGLPALLPPHADRILEFSIPIAMLMAVARHQFLDIDIVLRRGLIYTMLAAILLAGALAIGMLTRPIPTRPGAWPESLIWVAAGVLAGYTFRPLRRVLGIWVDRKFFRLLQARREIESALEREIGSANSYREVLRILDRRLGSSLRPRAREVFACLPDHPMGSGRIPEDTLVELLACWEELEGLEQDLVAAPDATEWSAIEREDFPRRFRSLGFVLAAALRSRERVVGLILLGPRETERHYVSRELGVLGEAARRASRRLERLDLARHALEEESERRRLHELNRLKSEFLSRVAHDLRTPLTSISWSVQNLRDGVVGGLSDEQLEYLGSIGHTCDYLNRLVQNLLDVSRLERGDLQFHCSMGPVDALMESVRRTVEPVGAGRGVDIRLELPPQGPAVWRDPSRLEEALVNLVENAVRYSPPESSVEMRLELGEDNPSIVIRDRGPGIPEDELEALFDRFEQGPPSPFASQEGFGLGLYIAKSYLEGMSGTLSASNHLEGGAVFRCGLLPAPPSQEVGA